MSLQDVPLEVFQMIAEELDVADEQSLRLACRGFKAIIPELHKPMQKPNCTVEIAFNKENSARFDFLDRLFRPGNVFHGNKEYDVCITCSKLKKQNSFVPILRIDDRQVCYDCAIVQFRKDMPAGHKTSFGEVEEYTCAICGEFSRKDKYNDAMHTHDSEVCHPGKKYKGSEKLCRYCHMGICTDRKCKGWPEGFIELDCMRSWFYPFCWECLDNHDDPCWDGKIGWDSDSEAENDEWFKRAGSGGQNGKEEQEIGCGLNGDEYQEIGEGRNGEEIYLAQEGHEQDGNVHDCEKEKREVRSGEDAHGQEDDDEGVFIENGEVLLGGESDE